MFTTRRRRVLAGMCVAIAASVTGCASQQEIALAIEDVNRDFRADYEKILAVYGTQRFGANRGAVFGAVRVALTRLGMRIESEDAGLGYVNAVAPAPRPLDVAEWNAAAAKDLPRMREIARRHVGLLSDFIRFEPEGLQIVINAAVVEAPAGSEVSLTMRMREVAPPKSGMPRREYAPPTAVAIGLAKIWAAMDHELPGARIRR
ncbi:MAG: hypothetical protein IT529_00150 [Burkholderiales bacterium]|nr:hypothetical protein [Burkholderiales bacterium]